MSGFFVPHTFPPFQRHRTIPPYPIPAGYKPWDATAGGSEFMDVSETHRQHPPQHHLNPMKNKLISTLLRVALPTATRHLLAALAGVLAIAPEADITTYITAGITLLLTWIWSLAERHITFLREVSTDIAPQIDRPVLIRQAARAAASQLVAAASGALLQHGYTGDPNDTIAITTFTANYLHSLSARSQNTTPPTSTPNAPNAPTSKRRNPLIR